MQNTFVKPTGLTPEYAVQFKDRAIVKAHIQVISEIMEMNLATRNDLKTLEQELRHEIRQLEQRMTIKLGTIVSLAIGIAVALTKLVA